MLKKNILFQVVHEMKCKLHGLFHLLTNGIFQNMDNNACTCDEQQKDAVEAGPSTSQEPPKDTSKKSRLNFFNICRDKSLPFTSKVSIFVYFFFLANLWCLK